MRTRTRARLWLVIAASASAALIAMGMAGCADDKGKAGPSITDDDVATSDQTAEKPSASDTSASAEAEVKARGFTQQGKSIVYGVVLTNPSGDAEAQDIEVSINALDVNGDAVGSDDASVSVVPPGEDFNI